MRSPVKYEVFEDTRACDVYVEAELSKDDVNPIVLAEMKTWDVLAEMLSTHENQVVYELALLKVIPVMEYGGHQILEATLVSQLNANPFLSKNMLIRVRNYMYFNNSDDCLSATSSSPLPLLAWIRIRLWSILLLEKQYNGIINCESSCKKTFTVKGRAMWSSI